MIYPINYQDISPQTEFHSEVILVYQEAHNYLLSFKWCRKIINAHLYLNLGSTLCVFLFEIDNSASSNDNYLWLVVGDIPPMYLDTHGPTTVKEVLEDYARLAEEWTNHVRLGKSIDDCYPFNAEPTVQMAKMLEKRIAFIKNTLINNIADISFTVASR